MNRGAALLARKRESDGLTYRELAKRLGCSVGTAHRLCDGQHPCASRTVALEAFRYAKVPLSAWDDQNQT